MNAAGQANQLSQLYGTGPLGQDTQALFRLLMQSPMWQQMMVNASLQGNALGRNLTNSFAQRGLTTTGVGTVAQNMGNSATGFMQTQMQGDLWAKALAAAMQNLSQRQDSWTTLEQQRRAKPSGLGSVFGGILGAAGSALPFINFGGRPQTQQPYYSMYGPQ